LLYLERVREKYGNLVLGTERVRMMKEIDYIISIADTLNITKAAEKMYISQPALSRYLNNYEKKLGVLLFERNNKELSLTACGKVYLTYAEKIRGLIEEMLQKLEKGNDVVQVGQSLEIKDFEYPLAVARHKNITKAAESMCISQPALSKYLRNLEEKIGVILFKRSKDKMLTTENGKIFIEYGNQIKILHSEMKQGFLVLKQSKKQVIRVGMLVNTPKIVELLVYKKHFEIEFPDYEVVFVDISYSKNIEDYDFVIGPYYNRENYHNISVNHCFLLLAVHKDKGDKIDPFTQEREELPYPWVDLEKLQELQLIVQGDGFRMKERIWALLEEANVSYTIQGSVQNSGLALRAVRAGVGEAFVLQGIEYGEKTEGVRFYCVGEPYMVSSLYLIYKAGMEIDEPKKVLLEGMIRVFDDNVII